VRVLVNSLGSAECRASYRSALQDFLRGLDLDDETRQRVELNPLRVLDDKRPHVQAALDDAPVVTDHLTADDREHHAALLALLADAGVGVEASPRLVRGLDYYTRTLVEFVHDGLGAAQSAVGGGGRYDGLAEMIGGPPLPGVGFALGVDRTVLALQAEGLVAPAESASGTAPVDVFAVPIGAPAQRRMFGVVTALRRAGVRADLASGGRGLKAAMKAADRSGALLAVVAGDRDLAAGVAQVKDLGTGDQRPVALDALVPTLVRTLTTDPAEAQP
jgi:histidyl-tRNA synthetase